MQLEQTLEMYQLRATQERQRVYTVVSLESLSASALYSFSRPLSGSRPLSSRSGPLTIRDFPSLRFQLHIHHGSDLNSINCGRIVDYNRNLLKELNGYEAAMADLLADKLGIKKIIKEKE